MKPYYKSADGNFTLYNIDAVNSKDIKADVIVTDPPYNKDYKYPDFKDNLRDEEYFEKLKEVFAERKFVMINYIEKIIQFSVHTNRTPEKVVIWVYNSNTPRNHRGVAFYNIKPDFNKGSQPYKNPNDKRIKERIKQGKTARLYDWWNIDLVKNVSKEKIQGFTNQIPEKVIDNILDIIDDGSVGIVMDPFCGTGTTGIVSIEKGKKFIGCDVSKEHLDLAIKRYETRKEE